MRTTHLLFLVFILCAFALCAAQLGPNLSLDREDYPDLFQDWKLKFGKSYSSSSEELQRFANFIETIDRARARNLQHNTDSNGLGPFADLTTAEFVDQYLMKTNMSRTDDDDDDDANMIPVEEAVLLANPRGEVIRTEEGAPATGPFLPNKLYDWRHSGFVSPIKDQGPCGSCWAFSATESVESFFAIKHGHLPANLSEQQLVDCDPNSAGCNGGNYESAFNYLVARGGQETNATYPYKARTGVCHDTGAKVAHLTSHKRIKSDECVMLRFVARAGPLSISLAANALQDYVGGVLLASACDNQINHAVQITGFKTNANGYVQAWHMRNSWGTSWGIGGYAYLQYGKNTCGLTIEPAYPLVS